MAHGSPQQASPKLLRVLRTGQSHMASTAKLWPGILMHFLINASQVLMAKYEIVLLASWNTLLPAAMAGALLSFLLLRLLYNTLSSDPA